MALSSVKRKRHFSTFQVIILGFMGAILVGALVLMLPISSASRVVTPFTDALFTATSAVCVTGLIVQDTATYWSLFGQIIILIMIQIGGLGVVTVSVAVVKLTGKRIGLMQRSTMQEAISAPQMGGILKMLEFLLKGVFIIELLGAAVLAIRFCPEFGFFKGIWYSVFHSVSAFCNAGFDLMGVKEQFSSLTSYAADPLINITISILIILGGIGFFVWRDVWNHGIKVSRYNMQSKVVLVTSAVLILFPALYFFFFEFSGETIGNRIWFSLFQAVAPRTAGFNTVSLTSISEVGLLLSIFLMLVGGSPSSTAGGLKTTTLAVLVGSAGAVFKNKKQTQFFGRRIPEGTERNAATILVMYLTLLLGGGAVICRIENISLLTALYETASAVGTVGLTLGITPTLAAASKFILMALMFLGRVGGLTLVFAAVSKKSANVFNYPEERITVG